MLHELTNYPVVDEQLPVWINGSTEMPNWLDTHISGSIEANGTFLIRTRKGQARVHQGNAVIEHRGIAYTCGPDGLADLVAGLRSEAISPDIPVGPGKHLDRSGAKSVARRRSTRTIPRKKVYPAPRGTMPTIEWIHVERLSIDVSYQRSIDNEASRRLIASIAANFDWRLCAPLVVSRRLSGELIVIDGQHRTMASRQRTDIPQLPCCVFSYAGPEEEARMFIAANRARKPMNRLDDFHAALAAADEDALEIQMLVTDAGLKITRNTASTAWQPREIAFTAGIASSIRKHGSPIVSAALTNMAEAFPHERLTHGGSIFLGLVKILSQPPEAFDPDQLFEVLKQRTAEHWGQIVTGLKGGDTRASAMRNAMLEAYASIEALPTPEAQLDDPSRELVPS